MSLSSQGGLNFQQSRLQDPTENLKASISDFGSLAQRFQDNKLKAEALAEAKAQQALENKRAEEMMAMRKSEFDTAQNTLRATAQGATLYDKADVGQALLDKQASTLNKSLDERIASLAAQNKMTVDQFNSSGGMQKAVEAGAFKDLTGVTGTGTEDTAPLSGGSMAKQAESMLGANSKNMQTQKQLIGEVGNQYFKEGQDGPMLYDPTSLNKYKQDLLSGLDTRIDREATRAQQAELERARLAQDAKQHRDRMRQQKEQDSKQNALLEAQAYFNSKSMPVEKKVALPTTYGGKEREALGKIAEIEKVQRAAALQKFIKENPGVEVSLSADGKNYDVKGKWYQNNKFLASKLTNALIDSSKTDSELNSLGGWGTSKRTNEYNSVPSLLPFVPTLNAAPSEQTKKAKDLQRSIKTSELTQTNKSPVAYKTVTSVPSPGEMLTSMKTDALSYIARGAPVPPYITKTLFDYGVQITEAEEKQAAVDLKQEREDRRAALKAEDDRRKQEEEEAKK